MGRDHLASGWSLGSEGWVRTSDFQGFSSRDYFKDSSFSASTFVEGLFSADPSFSEKLGERFLTELHSLTQERDAEMFFEGLLALGGRLEAAGKIEAAFGLYSALVQGGPHPPFGHLLPQGEKGNSPSPLEGGPHRTPPVRVRWGGRGEGFVSYYKLRAQHRLDALQGRGAFGPRAEFLIGTLAESATDYRLILPMVAGTMVSQVVRATTLTRLTLSTPATWLTRGFGARAVSSFTATAIEIPTFLFLNRGLRELSGEQVPWDTRSIGQDLITTGITLGALKLSSWLASTLPKAPHLSQSFATFFGLLGAHHMEVALGLRPPVDGATTLTDTLGNWVSLGVGAHLAHGILGSRWQIFQSELETLPERVSLNKSLNPSWALSPTPALPLPALPQHMLAMSRPKVGKPGEAGSAAPVRGKASPLAPLVGMTLPMMGLLGLFRRKKPEPKALPEPQNEAESRALIPFQYDQPESRLTWRDRLKGIEAAGEAAKFDYLMVIMVSSAVGIIGGEALRWIGFFFHTYFFTNILKKTKRQTEILFSDKRRRAQEIRIKKALNKLYQDHPSETIWDAANYLTQQRTAQQRGLSLQLLTARLLRRAEPEDAERLLGQIYGDRRGEMLQYIRQAKLKSGERLFLHALAKKGLRPEIYSWLIEGLGEIGSENSLPILRKWAQGEVGGSQRDLRIAAVLAIAKITRDPWEIPNLRNVAQSSRPTDRPFIQSYLWAMAEGLRVTSAGQLEVNKFLEKFEGHLGDFLNPTLIQFMARSGKPAYVDVLLKKIDSKKSGFHHLRLEIFEALVRSGHTGGFLKRIMPHILRLKKITAGKKRFTPEDIRWATVLLLFEASGQELPVKIFQRDYSKLSVSSKAAKDSLWEWILDNAAANPDLPASTRMALAKSFHELGRRYGSGLLERAQTQAEKLLTDPEFSLEAGELMDQLDPGWDARFLGYTGKELPEPSK